MDKIVDAIRENINHVQENIIRAAQRAGRAADQVKLVIVTKGQPVEKIQAVISAGGRIFGENYPQESLPKIQSIQNQEISWHMIGHLQSRKIPIICEYFSMLHSLDSASLAEKLDRKLAEVKKILPVLLEFNVGGEESKSGWHVQKDASSWEQFLPEVDKILACKHLQVRGIMSMPPIGPTAEDSRDYFIQTRNLRDYFARQFPNVGWDQLSMGTSFDYEVAIEEGSTFVRIGTAIVGPRVEKLLVDQEN